MHSKSTFLLGIFVFSCSVILGQNVGIGTRTANPAALLYIGLGLSTTKGLLVTGAYDNAAIVPDLVAGSRMIYHPGKGAFRAREVEAHNGK